MMCVDVGKPGLAGFMGGYTVHPGEGEHLMSLGWSLLTARIIADN